MPNNSQSTEKWWLAPQYWEPSTQGVADIEAIIHEAEAKLLEKVNRVVKTCDGHLWMTDEANQGREELRKLIVSRLQALAEEKR